MKHRLPRWAPCCLSLLFFLSLQAVPYLLGTVLPDFGQGSVALYFVFLWVIHPLSALFVPFLLTRRHRLPAILCFFHAGVFLLLLPFYPDGKGAGLVCLLLGVISAAAGETMNQRETPRQKHRRHRQR